MPWAYRCDKERGTDAWWKMKKKASVPFRREFNSMLLLPGLLKSKEDGKQFGRYTGTHTDEIRTRKFCEDTHHCRNWRTKGNNLLERLLPQMKHEHVLPFLKWWMVMISVLHFKSISSCLQNETQRYTNEKLVWSIWHEDVVMATQTVGNNSLVCGRYIEWFWHASHHAQHKSYNKINRHC